MLSMRIYLQTFETDMHAQSIRRRASMVYSAGDIRFYSLKHILSTSEFARAALLLVPSVVFSTRQSPGGGEAPDSCTYNTSIFTRQLHPTGAFRPIADAHIRLLRSAPSIC